MFWCGSQAKSKRNHSTRALSSETFELWQLPAASMNFIFKKLFLLGKFYDESAKINLLVLVRCGCPA
jgi:hypothetical protein